MTVKEQLKKQLNNNLKIKIMNRNQAGNKLDKLLPQIATLESQIMEIQDILAKKRAKLKKLKKNRTECYNIYYHRKF